MPTVIIQYPQVYFKTIEVHVDESEAQVIENMTPLEKEMFTEKHLGGDARNIVGSMESAFENGYARIKIERP